MKLFSSKSLSKIGMGRLRRASKNDVRKAFADHHEELKWLARFLTADSNLASACVVDACSIATTKSDVFEQWLEHWARRATIGCAVEMHIVRLRQLAEAYEQKSCPHSSHAWLGPEQREMVYAHSDSLASRLDVLCRAVLVMRGIERYSSTECALLFGIPRVAVEAAYCAALESLKIVSCENPAESDGAPNRALDRAAAYV